MRISDWSSDVCSSDLAQAPGPDFQIAPARPAADTRRDQAPARPLRPQPLSGHPDGPHRALRARQRDAPGGDQPYPLERRSEEHTSELQSLMRISYAVFCLKKKTNQKTYTKRHESMNSTAVQNAT